MCVCPFFKTAKNYPEIPVVEENSHQALLLRVPSGDDPIFPALTLLIGNICISVECN